MGFSLSGEMAFYPGIDLRSRRVSCLLSLYNRVRLYQSISCWSSQSRESLDKGLLIDLLLRILACTTGFSRTARDLEDPVLYAPKLVTWSIRPLQPLPDISHPVDSRYLFFGIRTH